MDNLIVNEVYNGDMFFDYLVVKDMRDELTIRIGKNDYRISDSELFIKIGTGFDVIYVKEL